MLWIGTADIKDLYVEVVKEKKPFLALIAQLIRRGVEVRLIHAKEHGPNFREDGVLNTEHYQNFLYHEGKPWQDEHGYYIKKCV